MKSAEDHLKDSLFVIIDGGDFAYEAALKVVIEAQRDALEAAAQASDDFHDAVCLDCMCGSTIADKICDMKPKIKELIAIRDGDAGPWCDLCGSTIRRAGYSTQHGQAVYGCIQPECRNHIGRTPR